MNNFGQDISSLGAKNYQAAIRLILPFTIGAIGFFFSVQDQFWIFFIGQIILAFFFLQTFILLHECAHLNFFKSRILNIIFGHLFGILSGIPFYTWQYMHNLHHKWTGWRDKDPTTEKTVGASNSPFIRWVLNFAWWLFIPIFYLAYKLSNYWNIFKIKRFLNQERFRKSVIHIVIYLVFYTFCFIYFHLFISRFILPAFILSMVFKELVIMTQHSHIEIPLSEGKDVKPIKYLDQVPYTRSFFVGAFFEKYFLFNFNLHEVHHAYPGLPSYRLHLIDLNIPKSPKYFSWFKKAKSMRAEDYVFSTSKSTGKQI